MQKAKFIFTKYNNSFNVKIENLENLSVKQIQEIENFVRVRNGIFDFNNYQFIIQKRLEFNEFVSLLAQCGIDTTCKENIIKQKYQARVGFGKYKGMFYSDIPDSYLLWLKNNYQGKDRDSLEVELAKRSL
ncbi:MAG: DUF3820 family protein [Campylobacterota bacterium]|nr:DUF3820 family protein [Campylobacterota bacterium]